MSRDAENIVLAVGNVLRGDDAAGPYLAKMMQDSPIEGWEVIDGGQTPEDDLVTVRRRAPKRVLVVDAAAMEAPVGQIRSLGKDDVARQFMITTHSLPISFLLSQLEASCEDVTFLGIQPGRMEFFDPLSPEVLASVEEIYRCVKDGGDFSRFPGMDRAPMAIRGNS